MGTLAKTRLANIMGLDIESIQHSVVIEEALYSVNDVEDFIEYIRANRGSIAYEGKTAKLDILASRYKKMKRDELLPHDKASGYAGKLVAKVEMAKATLKNAIADGVPTPFSSLQADGERFFFNDELRALAGVSKNPSVIIETLERGELEEKLEELFIALYIKRVERAETGSREAMKLAEAVKF